MPVRDDGKRGRALLADSARGDLAGWALTRVGPFGAAEGARQTGMRRGGIRGLLVRGQQDRFVGATRKQREQGNRQDGGTKAFHDSPPDHSKRSSEDAG